MTQHVSCIAVFLQVPGSGLHFLVEGVHAGCPAPVAAKVVLAGLGRRCHHAHARAGAGPGKCTVVFDMEGYGSSGVVMPPFQVTPAAAHRRLSRPEGLTGEGRPACRVNAATLQPCIACARLT